MVLQIIDKNKEKHILNIATTYLSIEMDGKNCDYNFLDSLPRKKDECVLCQLYIERATTLLIKSRQDVRPKV